MKHLTSGYDPIVAGTAKRSTRGLLSRVRVWFRDRSERAAAVRHLRGLDDRMLRDIGIERGNIAEAVQKKHR